VATFAGGRKPRPQLPTWLVAWVRRGYAGQVMEAELFYYLNRKAEVELLGRCVRSCPAASVVLPS